MVMKFVCLTLMQYIQLAMCLFNLFANQLPFAYTIHSFIGICQPIQVKATLSLAVAIMLSIGHSAPL